MKRFFALLSTAVLCLSCFLVLPARAESAAPLRVLDAWWAADAYRQQYPDRAIETLELTWDDHGHGNEEDILLSGQWDAACIETNDYTLAELDRLGLTLDLGSIEAAAALGADLYPAIRAGCSAGDKLVALPAGYLGTRSYNYRLQGIDYRGGEDPEGAALLKQLGFTIEDQPTTFAEVCALGLRYMTLSREARKGSVFLFSDTAPQGFSLLYNMILCYQTEATDDSGRIDFDTPAFRRALEDAAPLLAAFAADPKRTYGANGELQVVLCDEIGISSYGAFPRVTEGDSLPAFMTVVIVNPSSPRLSEAIDYALAAAGADSSPMLLYQSADYDAELAKSYDASIAAQKQEGEAQSVIDELETLKAAGDDKYFTPRRVFEYYAAQIAPHLVFHRWRPIPMDKPIQQYLAGQLDADGFIAALNQAGES